MMFRRCGWKKCCPVAWDRPGRSGHFAIPRGVTVPTVPHGPTGWDTENGVFPDAAPATVPTVPPFGPVRSGERTHWTLAKQPRHPHPRFFMGDGFDCRDSATAKTRGGTYRGPGPRIYAASGTVADGAEDRGAGGGAHVGPRMMRSASSRIFHTRSTQRDRQTLRVLEEPLKEAGPYAHA